MKIRKLLLLTCLLGLTARTMADTVIYQEDFSSLPLGVDLTNATWWYNSFNTGDIAYSQAKADGPDGAVAVTVNYEVFGGRWYGGFLRSLAIPLSGLGTVDPAKVKISFWMKGTSTQSRGGVGVSLLSFSNKTGSNVNTGAAYKRIDLVPGTWTQFTLTMAEMAAGIPNNASNGKPFVWTDITSMQVIFWTRNVDEPGWPTAENEGHKWSFSVADISVVLESGQTPTWAGYPILPSGFVDTGSLMAYVYPSGDWVWVVNLGKWVYLPESYVTAGGAWAYIPQ